MAARGNGGGGDPRVELCTFRVGGEDYAVDIMRVREIINPLPITPVPRTPPFVEGVVRLRAEVIPVIDVRKRFGVPAAARTRRTKFLIVRIGRRRMALIVDEVTEVVRLARSEIRPAPSFPDAGAPRFFLGVCGGEPDPAGGEGPARRGAGRLRLLLNVKALLEPERPGEAEVARAQAEAAKES